MARKEKNQTTLEWLAEKFTQWVGSTASIIVHTILFALSFSFVAFGVPFATILLVLTTAVSLEAIYLALFIQMSVNKNTQSLQEVEEDIDEIQEDVEGIEKDIDEIQEDVDEIQEDVEGIEKDIDEIQEDVDEIEKDFDRLEEEDQKDDLHDVATIKTLTKLQEDIMKVMEDLQQLKDQKK